MRVLSLLSMEYNNKVWVIKVLGYDMIADPRQQLFCFILLFGSYSFGKYEHFVVYPLEMSTYS